MGKRRIRVKQQDSSPTERRGRGIQWPLIVGVFILLAVIFAIVVLQNHRVSSQKIRVAVLNGCGVSGVASKFTELLVAKGFDVIKTGNAENFNFVESIVVDRSGSYETAQKVATSLHIKNCIQQIEEDQVEQVAVVIGRDYNEILERHK